MSLSETTATAVLWDLESEHSGPLLQLERLLRGRRGFTLVVLEYGDSHYRDRLIGYLERTFAKGSRIDLGDIGGEFAVLEERLTQVVLGQPQAIHLVGFESWPHGLEKLWQAFNYHRELIADLCPAPLLLWILRGTITSLALEAPDFWAWRSGVFDFSTQPAPAGIQPLEKRLDQGSAPAADRRRRIEEINAYLARRGTPSHPADLRLVIERGELLQYLGDLSGALENFRAAEAGYQDIDDRRGEALAKRRIADALATRGSPAEALRILREESLQVYQQLGDVRSRAITMAKMGIVLARKNQVVEARRLLSEALRDAERLRIPEAEIIRKHLDGLVSEAEGSRSAA